MNKKKLSLISTIVIGVICYIYGFIWFSKINTIITLLGGFLIFIPLFLIGIDIRQKRRMLSNVIIALSFFFIIVITVTLIGSLATFTK